MLQRRRVTASTVVMGPRLRGDDEKSFMKTLYFALSFHLVFKQHFSHLAGAVAAGGRSFGEMTPCWFSLNITMDWTIAFTTRLP